MPRWSALQISGSIHCTFVLSFLPAYDRRIAMDSLPIDLDASRRVIVGHELVATASAYLTTDVAVNLPFETLVPFKAHLRRFFSIESWSSDDADALSDLVVPHISEGWWEHDLGGGLTIAYGIRDGRFVLWVGGAGSAAPSIFDRIFDGPVIPEATPHPRKVKFTTGGPPAPGIWYRRLDETKPDDPLVQRLFAEPDVTDVMVAGDFVTIGIGARSSWERRLEPLLALVTEFFSDRETSRRQPVRTREELLQEANRSERTRPEELHLLDPDDPGDHSLLIEAMGVDDPRLRRIAVAVLLESNDADARRRAVVAGLNDPSRLVRRTAVDAAADAVDETFRTLFESALEDEDAWIRWKAVRSLGELGLETSRAAVESLGEDPDFQVRFEVARVLRQAL